MLEAPLPELEEGLSAVDEGDVPTAQKALTQVQAKLGSDHPRVMHLRGAIAWAKGDLETAQVELARAVLAEPSDPVVCLDSAELALREFGDLDSAERTIGDLLRSPALDQDAKDEAHFMMARSLSSRQEDSSLEQALEHLDAISAENRGDPACLSLQAELMLDLGQSRKAAEFLEKAIEQESEEPDLHYLCSIAWREDGNEVKANASAMRTFSLDCESMGTLQALGDAEGQELRAALEELFEDLPEPLLRKVANVPIEVIARLSESQVQAGADPRAVVLFQGQCASQTGQSDASPEKTLENSSANLEKIVVVRDMLMYGVDDDDPEEISDTLLGGLAAEIQRFFGLEDWVMTSV